MSGVITGSIVCIRRVMDRPGAPSTAVLERRALIANHSPGETSRTVRDRLLGIDVRQRADAERDAGMLFSETEIEMTEQAARAAFDVLDEEIRWATWVVAAGVETGTWPPVIVTALEYLSGVARSKTFEVVNGWLRQDRAQDAEFDDVPEVFEPLEPTPERKTWDWLGGYVPKLAPVVEAHLHSTDPAVRLHAFNKLNKYRLKASDGRHALVLDVREGEGVYGEGDPRPLVDEEFKVVTTPRGGYVDELRGGTGSKTAKRNALRAALETFATAHGTTLEELAAPQKRGAPTKAGRARLDLLAEAVREMRAQGFTQAAIGTATGRTKQRVAELERRVS